MTELTTQAMSKASPRPEVGAALAPRQVAVSEQGRDGTDAAGAVTGDGSAERDGGVPARAAHVDDSNVNDSVERLNDLMQVVRRELRFSVDEDSGHTVIRVIDAETREVIRQIPPEDVPTLVAHLEGASRGVLMDVQA